MLWIPALLALGAIIGGSYWLFRRTNRVLNVGLVAGGLGILATLVAASTGLTNATHTAQTALDEPYAVATAVAQARTAAFDAKSNENLTLIARGNGAAFEQSWKDQVADATQQLKSAASGGGSDVSDAQAAFQSYAARHVVIRQLDDGGNYDAAVALALHPAADQNGQPTKDAFAEFDRSSQNALAASSARADDDLGDAADRLGNLRWIVLIGGLLVALLVVLGYARRLREYR